jgi:cell division protein FtsB
MNRVKSLTQAYPLTPWRKQTQVIGLFLVLLVLGALILVTYLNVTARTATIGRQIQKMQGIIADLELTNADLENQLAQLESAEVMELRARELNFSPIVPGQAHYVVVPGYAGRSKATVAPPPEPAVVVAQTRLPAFEQSLLDWLRQQVFLPPASFTERRP